MFIAALVKIAKMQKPKGPFTDEWIRNTCKCINTMEHNSHRRRGK